jgi:serine/threonine protein kinase
VTVPVQRIGDYIIHRPLGTGGMGQVFEAEEYLSKRRVALKVLHADLAASEGGRQQFIKEMNILSQFDSPFIVRCLHCTEADGKLLLALEYLEGQTIRDRLNDAPGGLPWPSVLAIAAQILQALRVAHEHDPPIIHRDLKPENIMLLSGDRVKVLDFGIAKVTGSGQTTHSVGTLQYMSPEHIDARVLDGRSDLFSLGLVMWEMLAGHPAYRSDSPRDLLNMLCTEPTPRLPGRNPPVPVEVEALIQQLLDKHPDGRPSSAAAVLTRLDPFLSQASSIPPTSSIAPSPAASVAASSPQPGKPAPNRIDTVALIVESDGKQRKSSMALIVGFVALAAALVIGIFVYVQSRDRSDPKPDIAANAVQPAAPAGEAPVEPAPIPAAPAPRTFADLLPAREATPEQAASVATSSHKAGFAALDAGENLAAFQHFARASANDLILWKYPYNMACAAGRAGNMEEEARLSLEAAMLRDPVDTRKKARGEEDFASLRTAEWFQRLIGA